MLTAALLTALAAVPVFLLSAQSVWIRADLGFGEARFGVAVSVFFGCAALTAMLVGGLADRFGRRASTVVSGLLALVGGLGLALLAHSYAVLVAALAVLGAANAALQVTANLSLATAVPQHRQGVAFGVKQSAVPLAILVGGLSVPTVGAVIGWRWTFVFAAAVGGVVVLAGLRLAPESARRLDRARPVDRPPRSALAVTAVAMAIGSAALNSFGAFVASWAFHLGMSAGAAGVLMAAGSGLSICSRLAGGYLADRRYGRNLPFVAVELAVGALAVGALSLGTLPTLVTGAVVAFAVGWAWPGVLLFAIVRVARDAPAAASSMVQAGAFAGGAAGPAVFGAVVATFGYVTAWRSAAVAMVVSAALLMVARRIFLADLTRRPPRVPLPVRPSARPGR